MIMCESHCNCALSLVTSVFGKGEGCTGGGAREPDSRAKDPAGGQDGERESKEES